LKQLVSRFRLTDYTPKIIRDTGKFAATDLCIPGSLKQGLALFLSRVAYGLVPTYIFILKKVKP